uniref:Uncharacterized protein n=1 Tax=Daphnia galeata TaxID=27404 RepID=A0A8J2WJD6_9CRUS|nr:unnamed protein product [Daphnia galeata]
MPSVVNLGFPQWTPHFRVLAFGDCEDLPRPVSVSLILESDCQSESVRTESQVASKNSLEKY